MIKLLFILIFFSCVQPIDARNEENASKPVFLSIAPSRIAVNSLYRYQLKAMDSAGRTLQYTTTLLPAWLKFNNNNQTISGKCNRAGQYAIQITITAGEESTHQFFMLTVYDSQTSNLLCLGNSITNGTDKLNSYRRSLWQLLKAGSYNIDFVGSWNKHHMGGETPDPDFDMDHDGHSGWTMEHVFMPPGWDSARGSIYDWLKTYKPDIVLLELGTNDVFQCRTLSDMLHDLERLTKTFREKNKHVRIFIAQIPPLGKQWATKKLCGDSTMYETAIRELNVQIGIFCKRITTIASPVIAVDQFSGIDPARDMYDDIHPNESGEKIMAERWFNAISPYLKKLSFK